MPTKLLPIIKKPRLIEFNNFFESVLEQAKQNAAAKAYNSPKPRFCIIWRLGLSFKPKKIPNKDRAKPKILSLFKLSLKKKNEKAIMSKQNGSLSFQINIWKICASYCFFNFMTSLTLVGKFFSKRSSQNNSCLLL